MEVVFDSTKNFEKQIKKLPPKDRDLVVKKLNHYAKNLPVNKEEFFKHAHSIKHFLPRFSIRGEKSSLYVLRVTADQRIILTVDDDPIFGKIIVTLFAIVRHDDIERSLKGIVESLYRRDQNLPSDERPQ